MMNWILPDHRTSTRRHSIKFVNIHPKHNEALSIVQLFEIEMDVDGVYQFSIVRIFLSEFFRISYFCFFAKNIFLIITSF